MAGRQLDLRFVLPSRIGKLVQDGSSTALGVEYVGLKLNKAIHVLLQAPDRTAIGSGKPRYIPATEAVRLQTVLNCTLSGFHLRPFDQPEADTLVIVPLDPTWRFMGSCKWSYKSPTMGYNYSYPTYNPTYNYP